MRLILKTLRTRILGALLEQPVQCQKSNSLIYLIFSIGPLEHAYKWLVKMALKLWFSRKKSWKLWGRVEERKWYISILDEQPRSAPELLATHDELWDDVSEPEEDPDEEEMRSS